MFLLVPLSGDSIETINGTKHTVISYAPHKDSPAVYAEGESTPIAVEFSEINKINGTPVKLNTHDVFEATVRLKRELHLPQRLDRVTGNGKTLKVKALKLRDRKNLSAGMVVLGEDEAGEKGVLPLADVTKIDRTSGDEQFTRREFAKLYSDYLGA